MQIKDKLILIGVIYSAHGIKGHLLVKSYTTPQENILSLNLLSAKGESVKLKKIGVTKKKEFICSLDGCLDRNTAETLKNTELFCFRSELQEPDENEYYFADLKNMEVLDENGKKIGIVTNVANFGAGDIIEIKFNNGKEEMYPFTSSIFPIINENQLIFIRPAD